MPIAPGQNVGNYKILELIDSKEGQTYKVRNAMLDRFEVLRVLPKTTQDDPEQVTRFLREAKVHSRMSHPNIVAFYNATQLDGQLVMTSELVEGSTLEDRREASGALPWKEALGYISQALAALEYAHGMGVVHRNVTASNIVLTPGGEVKLAGFGLAKAVTDPQLTQPGTVLGSLNYISPEQVKGMGDVDARTDIYSLGVVLYEAITGKRPFERTSQFELMLAHVSQLPTAPTMMNPEIPAELSEIVLTAMAKDPAARFHSAAEFRQRIDKLRGASGAPAAVAAPVVPASLPFREPPPAWKDWQLLAAGGVTFLVVVLTMLAILRRNG